MYNGTCGWLDPGGSVCTSSCGRDSLLVQLGFEFLQPNYRLGHVRCPACGSTLIHRFRIGFSVFQQVVVYSR